jgi:hypothetical protein
LGTVLFAQHPNCVPVQPPTLTGPLQSLTGRADTAIDIVDSKTSFLVSDMMHTMGASVFRGQPTLRCFQSI